MGLMDSVRAAAANTNYVSPAVAWNIGERLEAQDPRAPARIAANAQTAAAYSAAEAQKEIARLNNAQAARQAQLQYDASTLGERNKQARFNTILSQLFGGGGGGFGATGGGRVSIPGGEMQNFINFPGKGLVAPPSIPGSLMAPPGGGGGGGFGGFGNLFGGGGGGDIGSQGADETLPSFGADAFSRNRERQASNMSSASSARQLGTEQRNIAQQGAARGYGANAPQTMAMQSLANQRSRAGNLAQQQNIRQQYGQGRLGQEMGQQGLLTQARLGFGENRAKMATARAAAQQPGVGLFSSLLSFAG